MKRVRKAGKYKLIYADPPWQYEDKTPRGGAENHYKTQSIQDLFNFPIDRYAHSDCALAMWATFPLLPEALALIQAWKFKYKTGLFTWVKTYPSGKLAFGNGRHTRSNAEVCLLGTRGKGLPRQDAGILNTHLFPRRKHSEKPKEFYGLLERLYGDVPRIELFARESVAGWDVYGNEAQAAPGLLEGHHQRLINED